MPESYTQVPPNSTGNKLRTRSRVIGADTVHEQGIFSAALPSYYAIADNVAFAANKHHLTIANAGGSGKVLAIKKLFSINLALSAITGVAVRFDIKRATTVTGGTAVTPVSMDSNNPALSGITVTTGASSVTEGALLFPLTTQNDELTAANTAVANYLMAATNLVLESPELQEIRLRPGESFTVKQITSTTVGTYAWLAAFTVDDA